MTALEKLLTDEDVELKSSGGLSGAADSMAVSVPLYTDSERKNASCKYRLVKNEKSIDIYEEGISGEMKEIKVRVDKHPRRKAKKQLLRYEKSCNNDVYENDLIPRSGFRNLLKKPSCCFVPSIKEAAIEAMVSILISSINCFAKDANFLASLGQNCLESLSHDLKSVSDLRRVILSIETRVKIGLDSKELKKESLKLFELIHGVDDSQLAACGNLYLGLVYKLQKERLSAKHLLHVFIYSPFSARTSLLPDLWNRFFAPNLSHLKSWYYREVKYFKKAYSKEKRMKMLEKTYNDLVDKGTQDLAMYYLEWLEGDNEIEPLVSYVSSLSIYFEISSKRFHETFSRKRKINKEPAVNEGEDEDECSEESSYPFRLNVAQGKYNELILRKLALETFNLRTSSTFGLLIMPKHVERIGGNGMDMGSCMLMHMERTK